MTTDKTKQAAPTGAASKVDPLAGFVSSPAETQGVLVDVEDPRTGEVLMKFRVARFGGSNNTAIIREERKIKAKLPQGVRRRIDLGEGDPEVVQRMNRQVFVRVSLLGWEMVNPTLRERYGDFSHDACDELFEAYPKVYDLVSEKAVDEETFQADLLTDTGGNSRSD